MRVQNSGAGSILLHDDCGANIQSRSGTVVFLESEEVRQLSSFGELFADRQPSADHAPKFDLRLIQRYVVKRVFALGWTT
jgi:hypothetical protein